MKILFVGEYIGNNGPVNVNKGLIRNFDDAFSFVKAKNKYLKMGEIVFKILPSKAIVVSGLSTHGVLAAKIAKRLGKKVIYLMHGCASYETEINKLQNMEASIKIESDMLKNADLILAVSKHYMHWLQKRYSQYQKKISYLYNGIERPTFEFGHPVREKGRIIATGGDRIIKNNLTVSQAVESMNGAVELHIYGRIYNTGDFSHFKHTKMMGMVPQEELYKRMEAADIFILNSILESFNLAVIDALNCGCNILISSEAGVKDLLELNKNDIIEDPMNQEEIVQKIKWLLDHPNHQRIASKIDYDRLSYKNAVGRLKQICDELAAD